MYSDSENYGIVCTTAMVQVAVLLVNKQQLFMLVE